MPCSVGFDYNLELLLLLASLPFILYWILSLFLTLWGNFVFLLFRPLTVRFWHRVLLCYILPAALNPRSGDIMITYSLVKPLRCWRPLLPSVTCNCFLVCYLVQRPPCARACPLVTLDLHRASLTVMAPCYTPSTSVRKETTPKLFLQFRIRERVCYFFYIHLYSLHSESVHFTFSHLLFCSHMQKHFCTNKAPSLLKSIHRKAWILHLKFFSGFFPLICLHLWTTQLIGHYLTCLFIKSLKNNVYYSKQSYEVVGTVCRAQTFMPRGPDEAEATKNEIFCIDSSSEHRGLQNF